MLTIRACRFRGPIHTSGFTLIEVLIALLVLSIGLLGVAAVQFQSLQNSHASYERSIATMQARDLVERLWAGICDLYDADGDLVPGAAGTIGAEDTIVGAWAKDHIEIGTFVGQNWNPVLGPGKNDLEVWEIKITWDGRAQGQTEEIIHYFRLPPPLRPDSCPEAT